MSRDLQIAWLECRRKFIMANGGSSLAASAALLGAALAFCVEAGHQPKGMVDKCQAILTLSGVKL